MLERWKPAKHHDSPNPSADYSRDEYMMANEGTAILFILTKEMVYGMGRTETTNEYR